MVQSFELCAARARAIGPPPGRKLVVSHVASEETRVFKLIVSHQLHFFPCLRFHIQARRIGFIPASWRSQIDFPVCGPGDSQKVWVGGKK